MLQHLKQTLQKEKVKLHSSYKDVQLNLCTTTKTDVEKEGTRFCLPQMRRRLGGKHFQHHFTYVLRNVNAIFLGAFRGLFVRTFILKNQILEFLCWDK